MKNAENCFTFVDEKPHTVLNPPASNSENFIVTVGRGFRNRDADRLDKISFLVWDSGV